MAISVSVSKHGLLTMRIDRDGDSVVVRALGQLDIGTSKHLEEELRQALRCDASPVVLDLGKVDFIDSTGLRVLLWRAEHSRANGDWLRIRNGSAAVRKAVETSGVGPLLPITA